MKKVLSFILATIFLVSMPLTTFAQSTSTFKFTDDDVKVVVQTFETSYSNKFLVLPTWSLSKQGESVKTTFKVDLTNFDDTKLVFYNYDKVNNNLTVIEKPAYSVDTKGNLAFSTNSNQGFVIVSNSALALKELPKETPVKTVSSTVYWVANGKSYHSTNECATLKRSSNIKSGTTAQAGNRSKCKVCH